MGAYMNLAKNVDNFTCNARNSKQENMVNNWRFGDLVEKVNMSI